MNWKRVVCVGVSWAVCGCAGPRAVDRFGLSPEMELVERDAASAEYRRSLERFHINDLHAEWQRSLGPDGPEAFAVGRGGPEGLAADPAAQAAFERRRRIADGFLAILRAEYSRRKVKAPFDEGVKADAAELKPVAHADDGLTIEPILPSPAAGPEWPRWRGPEGQGISRETGVPFEWSFDSTGTGAASKNVLWREDVPGQGNSSPIVWGDRIFLTTAFEQGKRRSLVSFQRSDGKLLFVRDAPTVPPEGRVMGKNGYASGTPATDGERVVAFFGNTGLVAFDFEGNVLWHRPLPPFDAMHGTGASPAFCGEVVVLLQEQSSKPSVGIAVDRRTGEERWRVDRPAALGWCTPLPVRVNGREQILYGTTGALASLDPKDGREIWRCSGPTIEVIPTVVCAHGLVYSSSGRNGPTIAVRPDGEGDVTSAKLAWRVVRGAPHVPSPIVVGDLLLQVNDTGVLSCIDARTGVTVFQKRLEGRFSASPVAAENRVHFTNEDGETFVVKASREFELAARNTVGESVLASPAIHGGRLFIRGQQHLFAIGRL